MTDPFCCLNHALGCRDALFMAGSFHNDDESYGGKPYVLSLWPTRHREIAPGESLHARPLVCVHPTHFSDACFRLMRLLREFASL